MTSFYFNKSFSFYMSFSSDIIKVATVQKKLQIYSVMKIAKIINRILLITCDNLTKTQSNIIRQVNCWHHLKNFTVENEIIINIQNFVSDWPIRALNDRRHKPFRILQQFHFFYKFDISSEWYTIDTFHTSNFTRVTDSKQLPLTGQRNPLLESAVINNKN